MEAVSLATRYSAIDVESKWYEKWEKAGLFQPSEQGEPFTITIPPPNITGSLHMGHALCYPLQDTYGRYQRLLGKSVLVLPGQDHAGIATQSVVDKQLKKEGLSASALGREKFLERVWQWREISGDTILHQFRALGCGFDWSKTRFTLDPAYAQAVLDVFINWFDRGLIFKGKRVVNWDPTLQTSVSDIETERRTIKGKLYHVRYKFADGSGEIIVATTRPETIPADVAVAVHPSDERYKPFVGKMLRLPLGDREIPLIADLYPDPEFGTGALKITPGHDTNDFQVGQRHGLESMVCIDFQGKMAENAPYAGTDRFEARKKIAEDLLNAGLLEKEEDYQIPLLISERSGEPIEPLLSEQWFVDQAKLAAPVIEAMKQGKIQFYPERYDRIFIEWLENIREWCISRQLWWGHRIPIFYTADGEAVAARSFQEAEAKAGKPIVRQEEDVLDTWFSSGLWPFATQGWPESTEGLKDRYPTDLMITDRNIISLWVARMAMMGIDLLGDVPFKKVMIYATVLNEHGQRMSKSLGTGIDPMGVIETIGADALRYILQSQTGENQDIRYSPKKTEEARNFCNKIWNATRFVLMNLGDDLPKRPSTFSKVDQWMLSRLAAVENETKAAYEHFDLQTACQTLNRFFWSDVCDWYIEEAKARLANQDSAEGPRWVLTTVFKSFFAMLHPVMPFITEELYSHLPCEDKSDFLMSSRWPDVSDLPIHEAATQEVQSAFDMIREVRSLRASLDISPLKSIPLAYYEGNLHGLKEVIESLAWVEELIEGKPDSKAFEGNSGSVRFYLPLDKDIDFAREMAKIDNELAKLGKEKLSLKGRLDNPQFLERARAEVIAAERAALQDLETRESVLAKRRAVLS